MITTTGKTTSVMSVEMSIDRFICILCFRDYYSKKPSSDQSGLSGEFMAPAPSRVSKTVLGGGSAVETANPGQLCRGIGRNEVSDGIRHTSPAEAQKCICTGFFGSGFHFITACHSQDLCFRMSGVNRCYDPQLLFV